MDAPSSTCLPGRGRRGPAVRRKMGFRSRRDRPAPTSLDRDAARTRALLGFALADALHRSARGCRPEFDFSMLAPVMSRAVQHAHSSIYARRFFFFR